MQGSAALNLPYVGHMWLCIGCACCPQVNTGTAHLQVEDHHEAQAPAVERLCSSIIHAMSSSPCFYQPVAAMAQPMQHGQFCACEKVMTMVRNDVCDTATTATQQAA